MGKATYGTGTIFKRGRIWYLSYYVNGQSGSRPTTVLSWIIGIAWCGCVPMAGV